MLAAVWIFMRVFAPERRATAAAPATDFNAAPMRAATTPEAVSADYERLLAFGSRYLGQPGLTSALGHVRQSFEAAGLEVLEQPIRSVTPRTAFREITRDGSGSPERPHGEPLEGVEIYPFMPNHLQPVVTPAEGLTGELVLLDEATLTTRRDFSDVIGVIDGGPGGVARDYGFHWARYAQLGVRAILIAHRDGLAAIDWQTAVAQKSGLISSVPVNYVRLAANEAIFRHLGQRVRVRVRVDFVDQPTSTLYGVLRATKRKAHEAIVLYAPVDAASFLPDLAPGALPAINTAYLLALVKGLSHSRANLERDVIFMAPGSSVMGEDGLNHLLRILNFNTFAGESNRLLDAFDPMTNDPAKAGPRGVSASLRARLAPLEERERENEDLRRKADQSLSVFRSSEFLVSGPATEAGLDSLDPGVRAFFLKEFQYVVGSIVFERQEVTLQAKLRFERLNQGRPQGPVFEEYLRARRALDAANAVAGSQPTALVSNSGKLARAVNLRGRVQERLSTLTEWHERRRRELSADQQVAKLFSQYRDFALFRPQFAPSPRGSSGPEVVSLYALSVRESQSIELLLAAAGRKLGFDESALRVEQMATSPTSQTTVVENNALPAPLAYYWTIHSVGYQGMGWVNFERQGAYQQWSYPTITPFMRDLSSLEKTFAVTGELALFLAHGSGLLGNPQGYPWQRKSYGGQVLVSNVGQAMVPTFPLKNAIIGARGVDREELHSRPGYWVHPFYMSDPYGRYDLPEQAADFPVWWRMYSDGNSFTPLAVGYGPDGLISHMKDEGEEGQRLFRSVNVPFSNEQLLKNITIVTFRAAPVSILDLTNPQNFQDYTEVEMITREGLVPFSKRCQYNGLGFVVTYLPPDQRANVLLKSGRPDNENVREIRAFLLGHEPGAARAADPAPPNGYLVADTPFLLRVPFEAARSMAVVNGERLALQNRYGMADDRTRRYQQKTVELLKQAESKGISVRDAALRARDAVSYAGLNHPVLRDSVFEAVIGILFYLGLLVPFVFFAEKLIFGFADVRRQLTAQAVIFLSVFLLLRALHPAFQMVRSSLMILLGFVIILTSAGITLLFAGRAKENLAELRRKQGKVAAAEVNTLGVLASSFLVGLNNMHRRKVRTGLTCATLTLITFAMICFTSTQNDLVDETSTVGRAEYQGLLAKHQDFQPMTDSEAFALKSKFSERFTVAERRFLTGAQDWKERKKLNPTLVAAYERPDGRWRVSFASILKLMPDEPLRGGIQILTQRGWFLPEHVKDDGAPVPVLIPDKLAERLGIRPELVDSSEVSISINETPFRVWGIFSSDSLDGLRDLDGSDILPFDIERVSSLTDTKSGYTVDSDSPRLSAARVLIAPLRDLKTGSIANSREVIASVAVDMSRERYRAAKTEIQSHLEKTALPAYFGLDGVSYRGLFTRQLTLAGLLDLLIPLLLAALSVLNTMKGSVYERKNEIYVYNAVGISPRYIMVMFLAEAFVYVVIGSVLGYLLSQGVGRALMTLGWTGGLNMTFTSLSTVYASLAIAVAVFVSTWFPARSALEIAAPAEESGWKLPEPEGESLAFDLPFNFRKRSRLAVLAFFERWLLEHGEGSSGPFFASVPVLEIGSEPDPTTAGAVPAMRLTVWLKPFDLAVSQELSITTPYDPVTRQYKARITLTRLSGTRESWLRLNHAFVTRVRRHFLHWRAVSLPERDEMFSEAKARLEARYPEWAEPRVAEAVS